MGVYTYFALPTSILQFFTEKEKKIVVIEDTRCKEWKNIYYPRANYQKVKQWEKQRALDESKSKERTTGKTIRVLKNQASEAILEGNWDKVKEIQTKLKGIT